LKGQDKTKMRAAQCPGTVSHAHLFLAVIPADSCQSVSIPHDKS
jgi:hypothetical protein